MCQRPSWSFDSARTGPSAGELRLSLTECKRDRHRTDISDARRAREPVRAGRPDRRRGGPRQQRAAVPRAGHHAADVRQLADPSTFDHAAHVGDADPQGPDARNLWRVHWYNDLAGGRVDVPDHVVLPPSLTGVESPIIVVFGDRFPMITAHKVLAAYACLAPRVVTGQFDPTHHRAIWPSTGNYARGGIAISRIMASRGVAILPEGMSQETFDWLDRWCANPDEDVIRTFGTESNVKEIYDACNELAKDPGNFVLNQFSEFGNHLGHYNVTGAALGHVFEHVRAESGRDLNLAAFTSATGSAGTIAAGDRLKESTAPRSSPSRPRVPDDARERLRRAQHPGHRRQAHPADPQRDEHRRRRRDLRQGDRRARLVFNSEAGRAYLARKGVSASVVAHSNTSGSRRSATSSPRSRPPSCSTSGPTTPDHRRHRRRGAVPERAGQAARRPDTAASSAHRRRRGVRRASRPTSTTDHMIDCTEADRRRIFNLGYYTWVEQQGTPFELFEARRSRTSGAGCAATWACGTR